MSMVVVTSTTCMIADHARTPARPPLPPLSPPRAKNAPTGWMLYGLRRRPERLDRHPEVRAELTALGFSWEVPRKGSRGPRRRKSLASAATPTAAFSGGGGGGSAAACDGHAVVTDGGARGVVAGADGAGAAAPLASQEGAVTPDALVLNAFQGSTQQANRRSPTPAPRDGMVCPAPNGESGRVLAGGLNPDGAEHQTRSVAEGPQALTTPMTTAVDDAVPTLPAAEGAAAPNRAGVSVGGPAQRKGGGRGVGVGSASSGGAPRPQKRKRADRGLAPAAQWLLAGGGAMVRGGRRRAGGSAGASAAPGAHR